MQTGYNVVAQRYLLLKNPLQNLNVQSTLNRINWVQKKANGESEFEFGIGVPNEFEFELVVWVWVFSIQSSAPFPAK